MKKLINSLLLLGACASQAANADYCPTVYAVPDCALFAPVYGITNITVSPLFGSADLKQSTVKEDGWLHGTRGNIDLVYPNAVYFGAEVGYKFGNLRGRGESKEVVTVTDPQTQLPTDLLITKSYRTKSRYSDLWLEGRIGFSALVINGMICPYFVLGTERERDNFVCPSPIHLKNKITYGYAGIGAISRFRINQLLTVGVNTKFKWLFNSRSKTGGNPSIKNRSFAAGKNFNWLLEIPVAYQIAPNLTLAVAPDYEYKSYKRHRMALEGTERTSIHIWGGSIQLSYYF